MGTLFEVLLLGDDEEHLAAVADAVLDEIQRIERLLSRFDPRSEISRINRLAATQDVLIDREVAQLLAACFAARDWTIGAFDITASGRRQPPGDVAATNDSALPNIAFDSSRRLIRFLDPETQLDLGAIGKGYALDRAAEILAENAVEHVLLHGGTSSVLARGEGENGQPWRIALRDPSTGEPAETIELVDAALSCSAASEQADMIDPLHRTVRNRHGRLRRHCPDRCRGGDSLDGAALYGASARRAVCRRSISGRYACDLDWRRRTGGC